MIEAAKEAIYNSLFQATSLIGNKGHSIKALPIDKTIHILKKFKRIKRISLELQHILGDNRKTYTDQQ